MDWMPLVPVFVIGAFLIITWNALSPIRFFRQQKAERQRQRDELEKILEKEAEEEARLFDKGDQ